MKNIIITAGGTSENIDEVRMITNFSTGRTGASIANRLIEKCEKEINKIYYICSNTAVKPKENEKIEIIKVTNVESLKNVLENLLETKEIDVFIHAMAVSDYTVDYVTNTKLLSDAIFENLSQIKTVSDIEKIVNENKNIIPVDKKISSSNGEIILKLKSTPKVVHIIKEVSPSTILVGFKLLNKVSEEELITAAMNLMNKNKCDYVVANDLSKMNEKEHNAILLDKDGNKEHARDNVEIADRIIAKIFDRKFLDIM